MRRNALRVGAARGRVARPAVGEHWTRVDRLLGNAIVAHTEAVIAFAFLRPSGSADF